jgi:hypothetical protein
MVALIEKKGVVGGAPSPLLRPYSSTVYKTMRMTMD